MRRTLLLVLMILIAAAFSFAKSSIGDWQTVREDIPHGWEIEVVTSMTFPCVFDRATMDELICTPLGRGRANSDSGEVHLRRDRIREIRVEKREGANMLAGASGGAGLAAVLGALLIPGAKGAFALGLGGASVGARHGRAIHVLHGKVIYRRPSTEPDSPNESSGNAGKSEETRDSQPVTANARTSGQTSP